MGIDDIDSLGSSEGWWEQAQEQSEKQRENAKKTASKLQKSQKDEQKSQKQDRVLIMIIREFLAHKEYEGCTQVVVNLLKEGIPSSFIIGLISLVYIPASDSIRNYTPDMKRVSFTFTPYETPQIFDEKTLPSILTDRINDWVKDFSASMTHADQSAIDMQKFLGLAKEEWGSVLIIQSIVTVFREFLTMYHISIENSIAHSYAAFILSQIQSEAQEYYNGVLLPKNEDILTARGVNSMELFGFGENES